MSEDLKRAKLVITGDVQGVFYRHHASKEAEALGLVGWCKNESDGSVYIVIEGESGNVEKFIKWAKKGSPIAQVENVEVVYEKPAGADITFEIR